MDLTIKYRDIQGIKAIARQILSYEIKNTQDEINIYYIKLLKKYSHIPNEKIRTTMKESHTIMDEIMTEVVRTYSKNKGEELTSLTNTHKELEGRQQ